MKIVLAQMNVKAGDPETNVAKMREMIQEAKDNNVDIIAFPEHCVGGYLLGDKWTDDNYCRWLMSFNDTLREASDGITVIYGNILLEEHETQYTPPSYGWHPNQDGRKRRFNGAYIWQNKKPVQRKIFESGLMTLSESTIGLHTGFQPKTLLPNYRFFDDKRYFSSLLDISKDLGYPLTSYFTPFEINIKGKKLYLGLEICEDLWCKDYRINKDSINPTKYLLMNGAEAIINISASPWTYAKNEARDNALLFVANDVKNGKRYIEQTKGLTTFYYVNNVGVQNNGKNFITFDGGTTIYGSDGLPRVFAEKMYEEELIIVENEKVDTLPVKTRKHGNKIAEKHLAITNALAYFPKNQRWVIGMSGGIDSAVVASLLVSVFGKDNVMGINMPSIYNSNKTKTAAKHVADALGIRYKTVPIDDIYNAACQAVYAGEWNKTETGPILPSLVMENVQARIRSSDILSGIAALNNAMYTCNGNKLEVALGYATLYGDVNGAICPLADLTKTEVVELAKYINYINNKEIIPPELIPDELFRFRDWQIQPSAELKDKQIDPMKFGYHCAMIEGVMDYRKKGMEDFAQWYLDGTLENNMGITNDMIKRWGIDNPQTFISDLEWFFSLIQKNVFKRIQAPPVIVTSKTAFGYDLRESQLPYILTNKYKGLKDKILEMKAYQTKISD